MYIKVSRGVMDSHLSATQSSPLSHIQVVVRQVFQESLVQREKRVIQAHQLLALRVFPAIVDFLDLLAFLDLLGHPVSYQTEQQNNNQNQPPSRQDRMQKPEIHQYFQHYYSQVSMF